MKTKCWNSIEQDLKNETDINTQYNKDVCSN
jgi:hypothetical protein